MEHGPGTFENLQNLIRAASVADVMPVVRVPRGTDIWIDQALDVGAGGIMIPRSTMRSRRGSLSRPQSSARRETAAPAASCAPRATALYPAQDTSPKPMTPS